MAGAGLSRLPSAARVARARVASLSSCGLSNRKAQALRELAVRMKAGCMSEQMFEGLEVWIVPPLLSASRLCHCIGLWTAAVLLLRGFGRLDVFPPGDVGAIGSLLLDGCSSAA